MALQETVILACGGEDEWEGKVRAGVRAALQFAAGNPGAASALTINARREVGEAGDRERDLIRYFTERLGEVTPAEARYAISTDEGLIESIATTVRGHLVAGTAAELPALAPELTYLALMPYAGMAGARRWAEEKPTSETSVQLRTH